MRAATTLACVLLAGPALLVVSESASRAAEPTVAECLAASDHGTAQRSEGRHRAARKSFLVCVAESCPAVVRRDCVTSLTELDQLQPSFVFDVRDDRGGDMSDVRVSMDGELLVERLDGKPINVDVGPHVFTFAAGPRYKSERVSVLARTTEKNRVVSVKLQLSDDAASGAKASNAPAAQPQPSSGDARASAPGESAPAPVLPIVLGGVGLVALGAFAYLGLTARSDLNALERDPCASTKTCANSDVDSVRTRYALADVALGVGVVSLGAAAWLWLSQGSARRTTQTTQRSVEVPIAVRPTLDGLSVQLRQSF